jgi:hypothetical protein
MDDDVWKSEFQKRVIEKKAIKGLNKSDDFINLFKKRFDYFRDGLSEDFNEDVRLKKQGEDYYFYVFSNYLRINKAGDNCIDVYIGIGKSFKQISSIYIIHNKPVIDYISVYGEENGPHDLTTQEIDQMFKQAFAEI